MHRLRNVSEAELIGRYIAFPDSIKCINVELEKYGIDLAAEVKQEDMPILGHILKQYKFPQQGLVLTV
jgi:hypothetical protein